MRKMMTLFVLAVMAMTANSQTVRTQSGLVSGTTQEGTTAFLGIPYAKVERFMPPLPVESWEGVRACDHWGPQVMQQTGGRKLSEAEMSEKHSCVLNVWTTDLKAHKPVMLWIHGGGFDSGASTWNPGMQLAKKDVVVVSLNHRLNILGFLDLSAVSDKYRYSGNVGMLDIVKALEWIRDNIAQFGGDPQNVTIFGESGGGGKVGTLMCMPAARGLFHKAIIMSGTILNVNTREMTQSLGKAVLKELGISHSEVDRLKDVPYQKLYDAGQRAMAASVGTRKPGTPMMWGFGPTPDGEVLLQQPFQPGFSAISDDVPVMIGTTLNELQRLHYDRQLTTDEARAQLTKTFGNETDDYISAFAKAHPDYTPGDLLSSDWLFRPKTLITADAIATTRKAPTYMYMFTWRSPVNKGSVHGFELNFCFNTLNLSESFLPQPTADDQRLADTMSDAWAQFAKTGNPHVGQLPAWQPYTPQNGELMVFDHNCRIRQNPDRDLQQIINRHCFRQLDTFRPADPEATLEAQTLYRRLWKIQDQGIMYGHQDDLMCGHTWWYEPGRSDTKDAVGDYPAVAGFELGEIELGGDRSLDSVAFRDIRERVQWWHRQNGIITVSWHVVNPVSSQWPGIKEPNGAGSAWDVGMLSAGDLNAVRSVLPGGSNHAMFNSWLDRLARFFLSWRDDDGRLIPFVFRPWHEHSGSFFWWGRTRCYDEEYASLWRYTVDFMRGKGLHNILYAYNTDKVYSPEEYLQGYPGDEYIDMLSIDWYGSGEEFNRNIEKALDFTTALAREKNKLHALSECGPISEGLQKILANYESVYLLTWRHAPPRGGRPAMRVLTDAEVKKLSADAREHYLRWLKQPRHEDLLKVMKQNKRYLFLKDISD